MQVSDIVATILLSLVKYGLYYMFWYALQYYIISGSVRTQGLSCVRLQGPTGQTQIPEIPTCFLPISLKVMLGASYSTATDYFQLVYDMGLCSSLNSGIFIESHRTRLKGWGS